MNIHKYLLLFFYITLFILLYFSIIIEIFLLSVPNKLIICFFIYLMRTSCFIPLLVPHLHLDYNLWIQFIIILILSHLLIIRINHQILLISNPRLPLLLPPIIHILLYLLIQINLLIQLYSMILHQLHRFIPATLISHSHSS